MDSSCFCGGIELHKFLSCVGFSGFTRAEFNEIIEEAIKNPSDAQVAKDEEGNTYCEIVKFVVPNHEIGILVRGFCSENGSIKVDYVVPYLTGREINCREGVEIERYARDESYAGVCDMSTVGMTFIFFLLNMTEYLGKLDKKGKENLVLKGAILSGLAIEGKILLPVDEHVANPKTSNMKFKERKGLVKLAKEGDENALESLTLDDMDTYSLLNKRIETEDVLSIVRTSIMPYGIENDQYCLIGEILEVQEYTNSMTEQEMYLLKIECNDLIMDILINKDSLLGEPKAGRRFKGNVWVQGHVGIM